MKPANDNPANDYDWLLVDGGFTLMPSHPYFLCVSPRVERGTDGKWVLQYRDFWGDIGETRCTTKDGAYELAEIVCSSPVTHFGDATPERLSQIHKFWSDEAGMAIDREVNELANDADCSRENAFESLMETFAYAQSDRRFFRLATGMALA